MEVRDKDDDELNGEFIGMTHIGVFGNHFLVKLQELLKYLSLRELFIPTLDLSVLALGGMRPGSPQNKR
jgi:hypothetical protein